LIGYLGCMFVLLIGPTGFGCAMPISCVKGAVLVDWVQGFCCVIKEGRAKGPCLHCFVAGDIWFRKGSPLRGSFDEFRDVRAVTKFKPESKQHPPSNTV
jgi:hypothetical protein